MDHGVNNSKFLIPLTTREGREKGRRSLNPLDGGPQSCLTLFRDLCRRHQITIDLEGRIYKILTPDQYRSHLLKIYGLVMVGFLARIIRRFPFYPITVVGNSVYSRVVAATLEQCNIKYALCKGTNRLTYYETDTHREIAFEGSSSHQFPPKLVSLIPHSKSELQQLQTHTGLPNLESIQTRILSTMPTIDSTHTINTSNLIYQDQSSKNGNPSSNTNDPNLQMSANSKNGNLSSNTNDPNLQMPANSKNGNLSSNTNDPNLQMPANSKPDLQMPVIKIRKLAGNIYYVMSMNAVWLTRLVITDNVTPLQPGEVVSGLYGAVTPDPTEQEVNMLDQFFNNANPEPPPKSIYQVTNAVDSCTVIEGVTTTTLHRYPLYRVLPDLSIISLKFNSKSNVHESMIYHLERARPFHKDAPIALVHPFHLPPTWDPFLSIMIVTHALVNHTFS